MWRTLTGTVATVLAVGMGGPAGAAPPGAAAAPDWHKGVAPLSTPWIAEVGP